MRKNGGESSSESLVCLSDKEDPWWYNTAQSAPRGNHLKPKGSGGYADTKLDVIRSKFFQHAADDFLVCVQGVTIRSVLGPVSIKPSIYYYHRPDKQVSPHTSHSIKILWLQKQVLGNNLIGCGSGYLEWKFPLEHTCKLAHSENNKVYGEPVAFMCVPCGSRCAKRWFPQNVHIPADFPSTCDIDTSSCEDAGTSSASALNFTWTAD
jgi:hypothetical protein